MPSDTAYNDRSEGADARVAEFEEPKRSALGRIQHILHNYPTIIPLIILTLSVVIFAVVTDGRLLSGLAIKVTLEQVSIVGILAVAQTIIILTAGIDLSVGAVMVFCYVVMGIVSVNLGLPAPLGILAGIATGMGLGAVSGLLVTKVRLPPFIVTLGLWQMVLASVFLITGSQSIRGQDIDQAAPLLKFFGQRVEFGDWQLKLLGAPIIYGVLLMVIVFVAFWYLLSQTAWGRHVYAVGDDKEAAELAGVQTDRTLMTVYIVGGFVAAIAAWAAIGRVGSISPTSFREANLDTIAAVVIGGTSLFGGRGGILGTLFGALTVGVFATGLRLAGADPQWVLFASGGLIILAVALDQWIREDFGMTMTDQQPILAARNLVKRYGRVTALDHCDFELYPGEILAVIGDNGAGKSSLIKALSGAVQPDEGEVYLNGDKVVIPSPLAARGHGIETVYQTLAMSPALSIAENMFMGRELKRPGVMGKWFGKLDRRQMEKVAREKLSELGLMTIQNINQPVETLSGGQRQGVAVARAAAFGSRVIILDEPTAALGVKESRKVLELILDVKSRGIPIILISHNMPHVFEVADRIHIHRLGKRLCVIRPDEYSMSDAVAFMTGAKEPPLEADAA